MRPVAFLMLLAAGLAHAQGTAAIWGTVTDAAGAAVPGAGVVLRAMRNNAVRQTTTDPQGGYRLPSLPPGDYQLQLEAKGSASPNPACACKWTSACAWMWR